MEHFIETRGGGIEFKLQLILSSTLSSHECWAPYCGQMRLAEEQNRAHQARREELSARTNNQASVHLIPCLRCQIISISWVSSQGPYPMSIARHDSAMKLLNTSSVAYTGVRACLSNSDISCCCMPLHRDSESSSEYSFSWTPTLYMEGG